MYIIWCGYMCMWICTRERECLQRLRNRISQELGLQAGVSWPTWVLGTKWDPLARAGGHLNQWAILSVLFCCFFEIGFYRGFPGAHV